MRTHKSVIGVVIATSAVLGTMSWVSARQLSDRTNPDPAHRVIGSLNDCIQERFREVDKLFGFSRIARPADTVHLFKPENVSEMEAVRGLEAARLRVVLYLAGRRVLGAKPDAPRASRVIKGPVQITVGDQAPAPLPLDLWDEGRRAMLVFAEKDSYEFAEKDSYEFARGDWKFTARPVRVNDAVCLGCHREEGARTMAAPNAADNQLRVGDPLGVILYCYQAVR